MVFNSSAYISVIVNHRLELLDVNRQGRELGNDGGNSGARVLSGFAYFSPEKSCSSKGYLILSQSMLERHGSSLDQGTNYNKFVLEMHLLGKMRTYEVAVTSFDLDTARVEGDEDAHKRLLIEFTDVTEGKLLSDQLSQALKEANSAAEAKSNFFATMSHEIRTPMNGVIGMTNILLDGRLDREQRSHVETIRQCGEFLLNLINDILDFSKLEAGKMQLEKIPVNLHQWAEQTVSLYLSLAEDKGIGLNLDIHPAVPKWVLTDPTRLTQIATNLISNAIKFTKKGVVSLELSWNDQALKVTVQDSGIGMSEDAIQRLYQPFSQAEASTNRRFGGTGLGMAIIKRVVEAMFGEITVESEPGLGTSITIDVPMDVTQAQEEVFVQLDSNTGVLRSAYVLVVDDNPINLRLAELELKYLGSRVDTINNGNEAIALLQQKKFDLVIMDCQMPEMDGYQTTAQIRALPDQALAKIPVIAFTANALPEDRQKCLDAGMDDYLTKPLRRQDMARVLSRWLQNQR